MSSLNKATLMGRLGADPEVRRTNSGDPVVSLRVCTSETWRDKATGDKKERSEWHQVVIFSENICKVAEQYLKKGNLVYLEGQIATRKWQDKDGQDRYSTEIVLKSFDSKLLLMPNGEKRPSADSPDDYGQERPREDRRGSGSASGRNAKDQANNIVRGGSGGFSGGGSRGMPHDDIPF